MFNNGDVVSCVITSSNICATANTAGSNDIMMNVAPQATPSATISASANNICSGTPVMFTVIPTNGGNSPSFQWFVNGIKSGSNSAIFTSSTLNNNDSIYCIMISSLSCTIPVSSSTLHVIVYPLPLVSFIPDTVFTSVNNGVQLTPAITGAIKYQWTPASGLSNTTIANPVANPLNDITYQLLVTTNNGCIATAKVTVISGRPL
ncbi:MAG: hypothetical protein ABI448_08585, partial [Bacteroidia bacterium]